MADSFPAGLRQPEGAMRFASDSLFLAAFAAEALARLPRRLRNPGREEAFGLRSPGMAAAADLGCGCGASAIALLKLCPDLKLLGVDREPELVACARENAEACGCAGRAVFAEADLAGFSPGKAPCCDLVLINPPYWEDGEGRSSGRPLNERARRGGGQLPVFLAAAGRLLVRHGRLCLIYPARKLAGLCAAVAGAGFGLRRLRFVRPWPESPATRVLLEGSLGEAHDTVVEQDLVLQDRRGDAAPAKSLLAFCPWVKGRPQGVPEESLS